MLPCSHTCKYIVNACVYYTLCSETGWICCCWLNHFNWRVCWLPAIGQRLTLMSVFSGADGSCDCHKQLNPSRMPSPASRSMLTKSESPSEERRTTEREKDRRGPYLPEVSDVKQIEGVKQVALLHGERHVAGCEERADVLQAQELQRQQWRSSVFGQFTCWRNDLNLVIIQILGPGKATRPSNVDKE